MLTRRIQAVCPSATLRFTALVRTLEGQGKKVINLAAGELDFDTPSFIKQAAIQAIESGFTKYTPTTGTPELKTAVAQALLRDRGVSYKPQQIAVTCGAKHALYNILQLLIQEGDEVLVPSPYWVSYPEMVRLAGGKPVEVRTSAAEGFRLTAAALEAACTARTRALILNSPSNPTGAVLEKAALESIAALARTKDLWIVSDEIYSRLVYGIECPSIASVAPEVYGRTILVDGVSKAYAMTGWRIGFMAGPLEVIEAAGRLQDHSTSNPTSIAQKAAYAALTGDQGVVSHMVRELQKRRDLLWERVSRIPKLCAVKPQGAFYCFVDISRTGLGSDLFADRFLTESLAAVIPGAGFGWDHSVRLSFATDLASIEEGLDRLEKFVGGL